MNPVRFYIHPQVERMVCGVPDVDIDLLESVTDYRISEGR